VLAVFVLLHLLLTVKTQNSHTISFLSHRPYLLGIALLSALILAALPVQTKSNFSVSKKLIRNIEKKYGPKAGTRLLSWEAMIHESQHLTDMEKIKQTNSFVNQIPFIDDQYHWKKKDYWATPIEFLASNGGDCEDFSIAKYFTLKALGIKEEKLTITYVKSMRLNQAHMVLAYYEKPGAIPLILDNLTNKVSPATERKDLIPVYSFNGSGLWLAKQRGKGKLLAGSGRIKRWQDMLSRMTNYTN
jgi:predicted transglutaminase-like cysteine proteinase